MAGRTSKGLSEEQIREIAAELGNGGKPPRVVLRESSSGLPAGTIGTVVRLNDPTESDEFVVVRINNDELPFTPAELEPAPPRGRRPKADDTGGGDGAGGGGGLGVPGRGPDAPQPAAAQQAPANGQPAQPAQRSTPAQRSVAPAMEGASTRPAARTEGGRKAGAKRQVPKLTVQLQYDERGWTVEATRGARAVLKATPVRPAAALRMAQFLDNEQISQAIAEIAQAEREEAERKAAELRSQLAEIEAVLAGYDEM